jgi:spermidine synthase
LAFVDVPPGGSVVSYEDGVLAAVSVVQDAGGALTLRINNRQQEGSSVTMRVDGRQAWLPLLLHPEPKRALFLGLGTGMTSTAAALVPPLQVDVVELLPEVMRASVLFTEPLQQGVDNPRLHQLAADARRYVRSSPQQYDVIIADNFHPARSGSGALYTVEHFAAVKTRLAAGGLFCQWLPLHQLDIATLQSIVRSYLAVYPHAYAVLASNSLQTPVIGLVAHADSSAFNVAAVAARTANRQWPAALQGLGLEDEWAVLGSVVAGPAALQAFAANAPLNTDDHPVVAYAAPRVTYQPESLPSDRLLALLNQWQVNAREVIGDTNESATVTRLEAYWQARSQFIAAGREVRPTADLTAMLAQVRQPLLEVLGISADFRPAYDPLLAMAQGLAAQQPAESRALLAELARLAPQRNEAGPALR